MLTPRFEIEQDEQSITIHIKAPHTKITDAEIFIDGHEFKFYSKPYFLRLNLPGEIKEDGEEKAKYDAGEGTFIITVPKMHHGEHFNGLDMITKLLAPTKPIATKTHLIEVIDSSEPTEADAEEEDVDWQIEQVPYDEQTITTSGPNYGFANKKSQVFHRIQAEVPDIIELPNADVTLAKDRRVLRLAFESSKFDEDYYLADLFHNSNISDILKFKPVWDKEYKELKNGAKVEDLVIFTDEQKDQMKNLPKIEYILDSKTEHLVYLGLVDLIFAYAYNHRTTEGENTVESGWTVSKLSATLSWLELYSNLRDVLVTSTRRSLCYPLFRHWELAKRVRRDVYRIFMLGQRKLLKCLLEIQKMMIDGDSRYILNDLYITDYCVWIQSVSSKKLKTLTTGLAEVTLDKSEIGFDLDSLEYAAQLALEDHKHDQSLDSDDGSEQELPEQDLLSNMKKLKLADAQATGKQSSHTDQSNGHRNDELSTKSKLNQIANTEVFSLEDSVPDPQLAKSVRPKLYKSRGPQVMRPQNAMCQSVLHEKMKTSSPNGAACQVNDDVSSSTDSDSSSDTNSSGEYSVPSDDDMSDNDQ